MLPNKHAVTRAVIAGLTPEHATSRITSTASGLVTWSCNFPNSTRAEITEMVCVVLAELAAAGIVVRNTQQRIPRYSLAPTLDKFAKRALLTIKARVIIQYAKGSPTPLKEITAMVRSMHDTAPALTERQLGAFVLALVRQLVDQHEIVTASSRTTYKPAA